MSARILIIEDEYALAAALATVVRRLGAEPVVAASGQGGLEKAGRQTFDGILLDIGLPDMSGLKVLSALRNRPTPPPVVIITAHGTLENALEARRLGAREYFLKPLNLGDIQTTLRTIIEEATQGGEARERGTESASPPDPTIMVGAAPGMQRCFAVIAQACGNEAPVLIQGPRGAGKTLAAHVIHRNSGRGGPLVSVRAGEWTAETAGAAMLEALAKAAEEQGTLLLEDIDSLAPPLQARLARKLAESSGARLLATSTSDLRELVARGAFAEELYYQAAVLEVRLPALTERMEDLPGLAAFLLARVARGRELSLDSEALAAMKAYEWPGNVRELAAAMQHAAAVASGGVVLARHLPPAVAPGAQEHSRASHLEAGLRRALVAWLDQRLTVEEKSLPAYDDLLAQVEKVMLAELLERFDQKPTRVAGALQMNRATLRRKLRDLLGRD